MVNFLSINKSINSFSFRAAVSMESMIGVSNICLIIPNPPVLSPLLIINFIFKNHNSNIDIERTKTRFSSHIFAILLKKKHLNVLYVSLCSKTNEIAELNESGNVEPATGTPQPVPLVQT